MGGAKRVSMVHLFPTQKRFEMLFARLTRVEQKRHASYGVVHLRENVESSTG